MQQSVGLRYKPASEPPPQLAVGCVAVEEGDVDMFAQMLHQHSVRGEDVQHEHCKSAFSERVTYKTIKAFA